MDARHFVGRGKVLSAVGTRRSAIALLAALPLFEALSALLGDEPLESASGISGRQGRKCRLAVGNIARPSSGGGRGAAMAMAVAVAVSRRHARR